MLHDKAVYCTFATIVQPRLDRPPIDQLALPLRYGGLGIAHTGLVKCVAAYLSTPTTTQLAMRHRPVEFRPFDGPDGEWLLYIPKHTKRQKALSADPIKRSRTALTLEHSKPHRERYSK
jgi:hypothetical protein